jgi:hypothetical protein
MKNNEPPHRFSPFADDISSCQIDQLTLENQSDRLSLYGSVQITCDQHGLAYAKQLQDLLYSAIRYLEQQPDLPEQIALSAEGDVLDNPFL